MRRCVEERRRAGAATLIARRGRIVHLETVGWADVAERRLLSPDTVVRIYSMTKPITVVGVMMTQLVAPLPGVPVAQQFRTLAYQALVG